MPWRGGGGGGRGQGSSEVKLAKGEVRGIGRMEYKGERWTREKVKTLLKRSPKLISPAVPCVLT